MFLGFEGLWRSPTGWHLVIEVKISPVYAIKTAALVSYIGELVSARQVPSWECGCKALPGRARGHRRGLEGPA